MTNILDKLYSEENIYFVKKVFKLKVELDGEYNDVYEYIKPNDTISFQNIFELADGGAIVDITHNKVEIANVLVSEIFEYLVSKQDKRIENLKDLM